MNPLYTRIESKKKILCVHSARCCLFVSTGYPYIDACAYIIIVYTHFTLKLSLKAFKCIHTSAPSLKDCGQNRSEGENGRFALSMVFNSLILYIFKLVLNARREYYSGSSLNT